MTTLVSFELAKVLKEKRFDRKCASFYDLISSNQIDGAPLGNYNLTKQSVSIPTIADVVMWLYEKHGIWIYPLPIDDDMKLWQARIIKGEPFNKLSNTLKIISYGEISYRGI